MKHRYITKHHTFQDRIFRPKNGHPSRCTLFSTSCLKQSHGFDANGSIAEQQQDTDTGGAVSGAGIADGFQMANDIANHAGKVAVCAAPTPIRVSAALPPPLALKPLVQALRAPPSLAV